MRQKIIKIKNQKSNRGRYGIGFFIATLSVLFFCGLAFAASNVSTDTSAHWAWNDIIGWIDFCNLSGGACTSSAGVYSDVNIYGNRLEGYAKSSVGPIVLNCKTTPNGDICVTRDFKVVNNGSGLLSGYAWNDVIGWISFWCGNEGVGECAASNYRVSIDASGDFSGFAWNEVIGWISFNCADDFDVATPGVQSSCGTSDYKINTSWRIGPSASGVLTSSVFDTGVVEGAALNTIMWQGVKPAGTSVKFRIASSMLPTGPWADSNFVGPDNSSTDYYVPAGPDAPLSLDRDDHLNKRYFKYRIFLESDTAGLAAPSVDDIIINWSR